MGDWALGEWAKAMGNAPANKSTRHARRTLFGRLVTSVCQVKAWELTYRGKGEGLARSQRRESRHRAGIPDRRVVTGR
jgi:hypothetical protein